LPKCSIWSAKAIVSASVSSAYALQNKPKNLFGEALVVNQISFTSCKSLEKSPLIPLSKGGITLPFREKGVRGVLTRLTNKSKN